MTEITRAPARRRARLRALMARLLMIAVGIFVALLITEVALRAAGFTYFNPYIVDQDLGYSLRPNAEGWWKREALTYIRINSHGFRDREHTIAKPPGTLRIAVLGDSFAEALQVPQENAFWSVMEKRLRDCPPTATMKVEVLNFGNSGFSTARELILLRQRVWQYSPDVIVLLVTTGNDIRDNSRVLSEYAKQPVPYFVVRDNRLVLDDSLLATRNRSMPFRLQQSWPGRSFTWARDHLRVLGLIYAAREAYQSPAEGADQQKHAGVSGEPGIDSEVFREPVNPDWAEAWQVTERLIVEMRDEVTAKGSKFLVVTGSMAIQVQPDPATQQAYLKYLGTRDLFYPDRRIKTLGEHEGFKVLTLAPALGEYANRNQVFLHGSGEGKGRGHWNETGHRLVGELIAGELCKVIN